MMEYLVHDFSEQAHDCAPPWDRAIPQQQQRSGDRQVHFADERNAAAAALVSMA
jgi:hypothetical protein